MRILFLGNNAVGLQALEWLKGRGEEIVGLVVHPETRSRHRGEMESVSGLSASAVFSGDRLREPAVLKAIADLKPDVALSIFFGYILKAEFLDLIPMGTINLHPALLPYNRGSYPNVWSIIDGTPAGVTLHFVDRGVDTGEILAQKEVPVEISDTGATLYRRLEQESFGLFKDWWAGFRRGEAVRGMPQALSGGTSHRIADVVSLDEIELDRKYSAKELIDILRARTFPPYQGAYFRAGGKKYFLRLDIEPEKEG